jgi:3-deoxy-D-manno-octulosonic-acid transferase
MLLVHNFFIFIIILFSPIIILIRIIQNKENPKRFFEKFTIFSKKKTKGKLIWFHAVSVGEFLSILPIIEKLEKEKTINQLLITSTTLTSSKLFERYNFKKTIHQFFPIDYYFFTNRFINYWKPSLVIFVDSEIWPSMIYSIKKKSIDMILLNARISKSSFRHWNLLSFFASKIFKNFSFTYPQNKETKKYLHKLGVKNIKILGNLKFCQKAKKINNINLNFKNFIKNKEIWCAMSTHEGEEKICLGVQKKLLRKRKNLLLIIIPRHINRLKIIENEIKEAGLYYHKHSEVNKIDDKTNVYVVDTYGEAEAFLYYSKLVFIGKSITKKGGQNPLEAARNNCKIFHGPHVSNFEEIYDFLGKKKISTKITNLTSLKNKIDLNLKTKNNLKLVKNKIGLIGKKILKNNLIEIKKYL